MTKNFSRKPKLKAGAIRNYVLEKMSLRWPPEQITGRAKHDKESFSISFPTIYRAIDTGILPPELKKIMRFK
jgi:IS30 family transposase